MRQHGSRYYRALSHILPCLRVESFVKTITGKDFATSQDRKIVGYGA